MIQIENLSKSFGSKNVLSKINIEFETGTVHGVVGENGAGKTTLFKCIAGLERYAGNIKSQGKILKNHSRNIQIGLLETNPFFFEKITGNEYLQLLCNARKIKIANFTEKNIFNLPLNQYASTYSTGMKKKLAFTAVLLQQNDFYILDEPYNGVDIQSNLIITEIIQKLKKLNKTIIISSHIFSTLQDTCDKISLLKEGKIWKTVEKEDFKNLEEEMKKFSIGNAIEKLNLK